MTKSTPAAGKRRVSKTSARTVSVARLQKSASSAKHLGKAIRAPISKKSTWFYVSVGMSVFFLTLVSGTLLGGNMGQYLQANFLADLSPQSSSVPEPVEREVLHQNPSVRFSVVSSAADSESPELKKLKNLLPSLIPTALVEEIDADSPRGIHLLNVYRATTLPFVLAERSLAQVDLYQSGTIQDLFTPEADGSFSLKGVLVNPSGQRVVQPLSGLDGFTVGSGDKQVYAFETLSTETRAFYFQNWDIIQKKYVSNNAISWHVVPLLDLTKPIEVEAAKALSCLAERKPEQIASFHQALVKMPNLTQTGIQAELSRRDVDASLCTPDLSAFEAYRDAANHLGLHSPFTVIANGRIFSDASSFRIIEEALR